MSIKNVLYLSFIAISLICGCSEHKAETTTKIDSPASEGSELPFLYTDETGMVFLSWVEPIDSTGTYRQLYATLNDNKWSESTEITSSNRWFVNWADYPSMIAQSGKPMAAHQLTKIPGNTYSYNVSISQKTSNGWSPTLTPHADQTATEHGFVSMAPIDDSRFMAIWLDGRRTEGRSEEEYFDIDKAMTLRSAIIDTSGTVKNSRRIDQSVCDCCQTSLAVTSQGPIAAYRNRTDEEIRDIYVSRYINNEWTESSPVHEDGWKIGACPVNGPKIVANDSTVVVAWYTGAGGNPAVKAAVSRDYGENFGEPFVINNNGTQGRVDAVIGESGSAYITEISKENEKYYLTVHKLSIGSGAITSTRVSETNGSRRSGFPQMEFANNKLIFAWTEVVNETSTRVATAVLSL